MISEPESYDGDTDQENVEPEDEMLVEETENPEKKTDVFARLSRNQEAVNTLLASFGDDVEKCAMQFAEQDISFKELSTLTKEDLELLGVKDPYKQEKILETFKELPKQNPTYDEVVSSEDAKEYNAVILDKINLHLQSLDTSLSATDLKLRVKPSSDVVLEDKDFASKFVIEALDELRKVTDEIEERLSLLETITEVKGESRNHFFEAAVLTGLAIASVAVWFWKFR